MKKMLLIGLVCLSPPAIGEDDKEAIIEDAIYVLEQNCIECHNDEDAKGEITLDRDPLGLDDPDLILKAISGSDPKMPKDKDPLLDEEIEMLKKWIKAGASLPKGKVLKKPE